MENKYQSIDTSIPHHPFDIKNAESNLKHLQSHVFSHYYHHGPNWSVTSGDMFGAQGPGLLGRQDSVPEEALFGNGPEDNQHAITSKTQQSNPAEVTQYEITSKAQASNIVILEDLPEVSREDQPTECEGPPASTYIPEFGIPPKDHNNSHNDAVKQLIFESSSPPKRTSSPISQIENQYETFNIQKSESPPLGGLPDFGMLNVSFGSSSKSESDKSDKDELEKSDDDKSRKSSSEEEVAQTSSGDKGFDEERVVKRRHNSATATDRRRQFRSSSSLEVFDDDVEESTKDIVDGQNPREVTEKTAGKWFKEDNTNNTAQNDDNVKAHSYDEVVKKKINRDISTKQVVGLSSSQQDLIEDDVFVDEYQGRMDRRLGRKCNSLPDLILSSSGSSSSASVGHASTSPDVTNSNETNVAKSKDSKEMVDGAKSVVAKPETAHKEKIKLKIFKRSVSFNEETQRRLFDDEGTRELIENIPLKDEGGSRSIPSTPITPEDKRIRFSESSGYITGSDGGGSREGASDKGSMESQSSHVWSSTESGGESVEFSNNILNLIQQLESSTTDTESDTKSFGSNTGSSLGSGSGTVINSESSSGSLKTELSMHGTNSSSTICNDYTTSGNARTDDTDDNNIPKLSIFDGTEAFKVKQDSPPMIVNENSNEALIFGPLQDKPTTTIVNPDIQPGPRSHTQPPSYNMSSQSNDATLSLTSSQLDKVVKEDERMMQAVRVKYTGQELPHNRGSLPPAESLIGPTSHRQPRSVNEVMWMHLEDLINHTHDQMSPTSLQRLFHLCISISDSSTPSPSPIHQKKPLSPDYYSFKVSDLERASRCTDNHCKESCCEKMLDIRRMLRLDIPELDATYPLLVNYCCALWQHCQQNCEELVCPVLYCGQVNTWGMRQEGRSAKHIIAEIQRQLVEPVRSAQTAKETDHILKLQDNLPNKQKEDFDTDILALSQLGEFGSNLLCCDEKTGNLYVQQTYPLFEEGHQLALYTRLRNLNHPHIVGQLWLVQCEETIRVYTVFLPGGSLLEYIGLRGSLPWSLTVDYMQQILRAVLALHEIGVVYLYWHSGNMMFPDCSRQVIKISGFGYSYPKNCDSDLGATKQCLPYNLCPPELLRQDTIDFLSDSWGAGCLMAEMLTGKPVWFRERHEDRDTVHNNIRLNFPKVDTQTTSQRVAFEYCWQSQPERRKTIQELMEHLSTPS